MTRQALNDLAAFATVAEERSFTSAARRLGVSASALSHAMRSLETRLGVRLLARTTRSVAPTEAGQRLLAKLRPALDEINAGLNQVLAVRDTPAGTLRITAVKHAVETLLMPMLPAFTAAYPDIRLEVDVDDGFSDIVADGYDAGIRFSGGVHKDMIAVPIGPELRSMVVGSPTYLGGRGPPTTLRDLADHRCITHRRPDGSAYPWPLIEKDKLHQISISGALCFNDSALVMRAAVEGQGIACVFADRAAPLIADGTLIEVLEQSRAVLPGYSIYYAGRRQTLTTLTLLIKALRDTA